MRALLVLALLLATLPGVAAARPSAPAGVPPLVWGPCQPGSPPAQAGFQCATATVPLDYRDPGGRTITLAVVRRPATGPAPRERAGTPCRGT